MTEVSRRVAARLVARPVLLEWVWDCVCIGTAASTVNSQQLTVFHRSNLAQDTPDCVCIFVASNSSTSREDGASHVDVGIEKKNL
eukprot:scaffold6525_cov135-Isochrysis_galbana.AAC.1